MRFATQEVDNAVAMSGVQNLGVHSLPKQAALVPAAAVLHALH